MAQLHNPSVASSSIWVLARFGVRMAILIAFATFGGVGFGRSMAALMWMAIVLAAVVATAKRERPFGAALNHWDEAAGYAAIFALVRTLN